MQQYLASITADPKVATALWEHGAWGMAIVGEDGRFLAANPALCRFLEYSEYELKQMTFADVTPSGVDLAADMHNVEMVMRGERDEYDMVKDYRTKTDRIIKAKLRVVGIRGDDGEFRYFLSQISAAVRFGGASADDIINVVTESLGQRESKKKSTWLKENAKWVVPLAIPFIASALYNILEIYAAFRNIKPE